MFFSRHPVPPAPVLANFLIQRGPSFMIEVQVELDFACCLCGSDVSVTLKCAGKGLTGGAHQLAAVKVPCPACSNINQLYFEPSGRLHAVRPCAPSRGLPEPSIN